jgi:kynurenine formamidase
MPKIIDLTIPPRYGCCHPMFRKCDQPVSCSWGHRHRTPTFRLAIHTATHIDAPYHFFARGQLLIPTP